MNHHAKEPNHLRRQAHEQYDNLLLCAILVDNKQVWRVMYKEGLNYRDLDSGKVYLSGQIRMAIPYNTEWNH